MVKAKTVLKDKFWIIEDRGQRLGTLTADEDSYMYTCDTGVQLFKDKSSLKKTLGKIEWSDINITASKDKLVNEYPTSSVPYNCMFDVKRKLPLFTKSEKSKSVYCAGYYVIEFEKGWVKSFCPKLITIERYNSKGPFKTEIEMRQELSRVNSK